MAEVRCSVCDPTGRGRYCARGRCYCGHPECWAADSFVELPPITREHDDTPPTTKRRGKRKTTEAARTAWADRDEGWIDRL